MQRRFQYKIDPIYVEIIHSQLTTIINHFEVSLIHQMVQRLLPRSLFGI